jgi:hypothetical protein
MTYLRCGDLEAEDRRPRELTSRAENKGGGVRPRADGPCGTGAVRFGREQRIFAHVEQDVRVERSQPAPSSSSGTSGAYAPQASAFGLCADRRLASTSASASMSVAQSGAAHTRRMSAACRRGYASAHGGAHTPLPSVTAHAIQIRP